MKRYLLPGALFAIVMIGCSKDDDDDNNNLSPNMQLITASAWRYDDAGVDANNDGTIDTPLPPGSIEDCDIDNTFTFNSNGTGVADEGPTKCDPSSPQTANFSWSFANNETEIVFPDTLVSGLSGTVRLRSLTATSMVLSQELDIGLPIDVNVVVKLKH
jgi:hypothetical protein